MRKQLGKDGKHQFEASKNDLKLHFSNHPPNRQPAALGVAFQILLLRVLPRNFTPSSSRRF